MLSELCRELNNYFCRDDADKITGTFAVVDGELMPPVYFLDGQYYRIVGSVFNDGVHNYRTEPTPEDETLKDEPEFDGQVWKMRVPQEVLNLAERISEWRTKNEAADSPNMSPYQSESFGIYSYSKGSSGQSKSGAGSTAVSWQSQFASELNKYRRVWGV